MADFGYDISDFKEVDPLFGTNEDLKNLFDRAHELGIKIIFDFVPNHTSDEHEWFIKSVARDPEYEDYFMWADKKGDDENGIPIPPNNWVSVFYGSAWEWNNERQQFYLHQFDKKQPDLDYRNPKVQQAMKDVLTYWLDMGCDGFRIDAINHMFEDERLLDEPLSGNDDPNDYGYTDKIYTKDQPETYEIVYDWRELLDNYQLENGGDQRIMMTEAYANTRQVQLYYGNGLREGSHMPFNFILMEIWEREKLARVFNDRIHQWFDPLNKKYYSNWVLGNHDKPRFSSAYGEQMTNVLHTLVMTLPGIVVTYNGDEIGMVNHDGITWEETKDPQACNKGDPEDYQYRSRDPSRTPYQWDDSIFAGFTGATATGTWLPVNPDYLERNLKKQIEESESVFKYYKQLTTLRQDPIFADGDFTSKALSDNVLLIERSLESQGRRIVVLNMGGMEEEVNILDPVPKPSFTIVKTISVTPQSSHKAGDKISAASLKLAPYESLVVEPVITGNNDWWKQAVFYQVYPRSFKDSNNDGVGDINGVTEKLDYLKESGVTAFWLSTVLKSPMVDLGYDISDFEEIDPLFGTNADFKLLIDRAHELGMKVIFDFVPNHTSDEHEWFIKSVARDPEYEDFYVWTDNVGFDEYGKPFPKNNWISKYSGQAWEWSNIRQQFYLHQFGKKQPDLNYRHPGVQEAMKSVLIYWLDMGVDGFRFDDINYMFEVEGYPDELESGLTDDPENYDFTIKSYTKDLYETYETLYDWRELLDNYQQENGGDQRIIMTEAFASTNKVQQYFGTASRAGSHIPLNVILLDAEERDQLAISYSERINAWLSSMNEKDFSNWVLGDHDRSRIASIYGEQMSNVLHTLVMTLPGIAVTYYGDEIGMVDHNDITWEDTKDPLACSYGDPEDYGSRSRDPARTPFQWDNSDFAGFTLAEESWLPVNPDYIERNLKKQQEEEESVYNYYKQLTELRKHPIFTDGDFEIKSHGDNVLVIERSLAHQGHRIVLLNMGGDDESISIANSNPIPQYTMVQVISASPHASHKVGDKLATSALTLAAYDSLIVEPIIIGSNDWWKHAVFYQVYPRSFKDTNGDGVGDINGVIEKLDYLKDAGVTGLWLSPVLKSPMADFGYDISDFTLVDPLFGTNDDLKNLFEKAHELGIKIILDFVPNHTSDEHEWFVKSAANDPEYADFYVWLDPAGYKDGEPIPPNNWVSFFYGSAWTWNNIRQKFYLHHFDRKQPDLNYRNPKVVEAMANVLTYWLDMGADGFRVDAINHMFETVGYPDEPLSGWTDDPLDPLYTIRIHTKDLDDTYEMIYDWRELLDNYQERNGGDQRLMMTEAYTSLENTKRYFGDGKRKGAHMPFNFALLGLRAEKLAQEFHNKIHEWYDDMEAGNPSNWVLGNHDQPRFASAYGEPMSNVLHTLTMSLPGIAVTYYGDEIGMLSHTGISFEDTRDPQACNKGDPETYQSLSRDPSRTPFQWDDSEYAGFTSASATGTWLPVHPDYKTRNLQQQRLQEKSVFKYYQQLTALRSDPIFELGDFKSKVYGNNVLVVERSLQNREYITLLNMGNVEESINFSDMINGKATVVRVIAASPQSRYSQDAKIELSKLTLAPYDSLIVEPIVLGSNDWWKSAVFYQIYPRSFKDTDDDGVGDIKGVIEKIEHLKDAGVTGLWLSPVFKSPMADFGYDISDFYRVDPLFGTNDDLKNLFDKAHELGIKIILDFVPNHTSDEHEWFIRSAANDAEYRDFYVWHNGNGFKENGEPIPPNNWVSFFYGSAWTWHNGRQQFYLHQFDKKQPDLNYRNPKVVEAMANVLTYWLDMGAAGFRVDAINHMFETVGFPDEPLSGMSDDPLDPLYTDRIHTKDLDETYEIIYDWRELLDNYQAVNGGDQRLMMTEAYTSMENTKRYYGDGKRNGAHMPFNFVLLGLNSVDLAQEFDNKIHEWYDNLSSARTSNWVLGNHDQQRFASVYGEPMSNVLHTLTMTLPGIAVTYYGDEIGMLSHNGITFEETRDPQACNKGDPESYQSLTRDPSRTPFQWDDTKFAGFTSENAMETWLPVHPNYLTRNLKQQKMEAQSVFKYYQLLTKLKQDPILKYGEFTSKVYGNNILVFERTLKSVGQYIVIMNLGDRLLPIDISDITNGVASYYNVLAASPDSVHFTGSTFSSTRITVQPYDAMIVQPIVIGDNDWWKQAVFYQVYPRSFKDTNNDGVGDINGVIEKLEHFRDAGIKGLWLSPLLKSPMADFGYDISDFKEVDPLFGTNEDLKTLFDKAHELGIKIIFDFVPNHTSDEHEWFIKSVARDPEYEDYFMWADKKGDDENGIPIPPNNWVSVFYGSAWEWNNERQQFYLHQFDKKQPDLDYRNPKVQQAMKDVLTYWLDMGCDGFRIDAINHMFEDERLLDEPLSGNDDPNDYGYTDKIYTKDQPETYEIVYDWRELLDDYQNKFGGDQRIMMTEAYADTQKVQRYYGDGVREGSHMPFNFILMETWEREKLGKVFNDLIIEWLDPLNAKYSSNWVLGNHDKSRFASKFGEPMTNVLHTLVMTLPGIAITYNGDEIGMVDHTGITWDETVDPQACNKGDPNDYQSRSRDPARTPFQWDDTAYAGFTGQNAPGTWLPVNPDYRRRNLKNQKEAEQSVFKYYQQLTKLRNDEILKHGVFKSKNYGDNVLVISRTLENGELFVVILNMGGDEELLDISDFGEFPDNFEVVLASPSSSFNKNNLVNTTNIALQPYDSIVVRPKLISEPTEKEWWENAILYQIYPRSFQDSDNDGIGDLKGIISRLDHLEDLGVTAVWLSPIFKSPMADFGYDISDFKQVDPIFGTMQDLEDLFAQAATRAIRIILDFVPNHTSDEHEWFVKSIQRDPEYRDFYVWRDAKYDEAGLRQPPNNWVSVFYGSAWTWNAERGQYYLHQFDKKQPDLNYRNPNVVAAMKDVLTFWMEKGASGFRMDAVNHIMEVEDFRDDPRNYEVDDPQSWDFVHHHYTIDLDDTYEVIYDLRAHIRDWVYFSGLEPKIMMTEAYTNLSRTMMYYGSEDDRKAGAHFPFNFMLINWVDQDSDAYKFKEVIELWLSNMPKGGVANWVLGNHDRPRFASRYGASRVAALTTLSMTLPGVVVTYNGDEIGMEDYRDISFEDTVDPQACNVGDFNNYKELSRDPQRTPFQWDDTAYAGFSEFKPWLPVHPNYETLNLANQKTEERSQYKLYKDLAALRKHETMTHGDIRVHVLSKRVLTFIREYEGNEEAFVIVIKFDDLREDVDLLEVPRMAENLTVVTSSPGAHYKSGDIVQASELRLNKYDALVLSTTVIDDDDGGAATIFLSIVLVISAVLINLLNI